MVRNPMNLYFPIAHTRAKQRTHASRGHFRNAERGAWIAAAICLLAIGVLLFPFRGGTLDGPLMFAINAWMSKLPFIGLQTAILEEDIAQLIIGIAAVALWFRSPVSAEFRERIILALAAFFPTYAFARLIQHLGTRPRPITDHAIKVLGDRAIFDETRQGFTHWASFPSDHAALLAIATILAFMVGRRTGIIALVLASYSCVFRIAYGYHWPSDIAGGALLGTVIFLVLLSGRRVFRPFITHMFAFMQKRPGIAAAIGAFIVIEFSETFHYSKLFTTLVLHTRLFH
jgi:membrane-associated phospholipid phosphatase